MLRFLLKCCLFVFLPLPILLPVAFVIHYLADAGLRKTHAEYYGIWNDIYDGNLNSDIWVMGSSRAFVHISPEILEKDLGKTVYNLGVNAYPFPMQKERLNIALKHNQKPTYIIQSLDDNTLFNRGDLYEKEQFIPYLNDSDIYSATQKYTGRFTLLYKYIPLYKYRDNRDRVLLGIKSYFGADPNENDYYKGYQGQIREWDEVFFQDFFAAHPNGLVQSFSPQDAEMFDEYLTNCRNANIKMIFVFTPTYIEGQKMVRNRQEIMNYYDSVSKKYGIPFLDYSNHPLTLNKGNFYNNQHLTKRGSEIFSKILAQDLSQITN